MIISVSILRSTIGILSKTNYQIYRFS